MKVYIERVKEYDKEALYRYFSGIWEEEQLGKKLSSASHVLLKPNLLGTHAPESAVTTHPLVVQSIIRILKENGVKDILLGDSPGGTFRTEKVWEITGMKALAEKEGVTLISFGKEGVTKRIVDGFELYIDSQVLNAPAIINIAKYKTHSLTMFTGAVKNLFGVVPGLQKSEYHRLYPDPVRFAALIASIYKLIESQVVLNVIDGIWGMEGEGPSAGEPRNFGVMFASESAAAVDYSAARMMGYDSLSIPLIELSMKNENLSERDIKEEREWAERVFPKVKKSRASRYSRFISNVPDFIQRIFYHLYDFYPAFNNKCRLCRICVESCPVEAIAIGVDETKPVIDYQKCIKCMCCHEFCPYQAVYIKKTLLAKILMD